VRSPAPAFRIVACVLWAGILLGSGCATVESLQGAERGTRLNDSLRLYEKLVRWGEFAVARRYIRPRPEQPALAAAQSSDLLESISVTHYRLVGLELNPERTRASVSHELRFYHQDERREVAVVDRQLWWWDDEAARWFLDGDLPDFAGALVARR